MGEELKYQLRLTLSDPFAKVARNHPDDPSIASLTQLLRRHDAALKCQYDAFADYLKEAEASGLAKFSASRNWQCACKIVWGHKISAESHFGPGVPRRLQNSFERLLRLQRPQSKDGPLNTPPPYLCCAAAG